MSSQYISALAQASLGNAKAEIVIKNGQIVNVFTKEIIQADVAISKGVIVGIGNYKGEQEIDVSGKIVCPGFIDAHLHLESTMVRPEELIHRAALKGTTTFIVDPHEAANVAGIKGIEYILEQTEKVEANVFVMIPSCVPAMDIEDNGAVILAEDMKRFLEHPRVLGLGEVMDLASVINVKETMLDKLELFRTRVLDGHAGYLSNEQLMCYRLAGIDTDHECCDFETAMQEVRAGIQVLIREGTAAKNLEAIVSGIVKNQIPTERFSFCTDDKHIADIEREGHISFHVKRAAELGISPIEAIKMATIHTARTYGLKNYGAVAPGYQADIVILSDLEKLEVERVYFKGKPVALKKSKTPSTEIDACLLNTVNIGSVNIRSFEMKRETSQMPVIQMLPEQILTAKTIESVPLVEGVVKANGIYNKVAVFERHKATENIGLAIVKGYHIQNGAIATTFCHDSHNILVIGDNDGDMLLAVEELVRCQGGYTVVEDGRVVYTLELPVMGLISNEGYEVVSKKLEQMIEKVHRMGVPDGIDPFIALSFLSLPVIPEIRITARGVYDVLEEKFIGENLKDE